MKTRMALAWTLSDIVERALGTCRPLPTPPPSVQIVILEIHQARAISTDWQQTASNPICPMYFLFDQLDVNRGSRVRGQK